MNNNIRVYESSDMVAHMAADYIQEIIFGCIADKGQCHIVLAGGTAPEKSLDLLANKPLAWHAIHWYLGDERCCSDGHAQRNDTMIKNLLFRFQKESLENFHPIRSELGPEQAAKNYAELIDTVVEKNSGFDIVLFGMGEDGHTASLFPGNIALQDKRTVVPVFNAPKPPEERVSLGLSTLQNGRHRIVITTGESKRVIFKKTMSDKSLPISQINADVWFVDEAVVYE